MIPRARLFGYASSVVVLLVASSSLAADVSMVLLSGAPEQIGTTWGELNKEAIVRDMEATFLSRAKAAGISKETLIERAAVRNRIVEEIAPHWLAEARAIARAAGVDEELYIAFSGTVTRGVFLKAEKKAATASTSPAKGAIVECTSYSVPRDRAENGTIFFHKTRDNKDRSQVAIIVESSVAGVNKFIGVTDVGTINPLSMAVNDKGVAIAGDYPANLKKDSSTLVLPPAKPQYRGLGGGAVVRHIAERASSSKQALEILTDLVKKGYYAGGDVNGKHWLFVDRQGVILEACSNARHVVSMVHTKEAYFSRFNKSEPVIRLRAADKVDFPMFQSVFRERPILTGQSVSGMTVEIDPECPHLLTVAWISLPARLAAIPVFMGQRRTPASLADGTVYALGKGTATRGDQWKAEKSRWEAMESAMHAEKEALRQDVKKSIKAGNPLEADIERLENWSKDKTAAVLEAVDGTK